MIVFGNLAILLAQFIFITKQAGVKIEQIKADTIIIGGGVIGSAIAYFLAADKNYNGNILVVEKDPTYAQSSTALSVGGIRQQFSTAENIEMSKFSAQFFKRVDEYLTVDDETPQLSFKENGYLFLASEKGLPVLQQNHELQKKHGFEVAFLTTPKLDEKYNWLNTSGIAAGTLGLENEGWLDPYSLLMAFKKKAAALGVKYVKDNVVALTISSGKISGVKLEQSGEVGCQQIVNAAGSNAAEIAEMAGIQVLPVRSRKRFVFAFECGIKMPNCPLVVDPSGVYFRPEGDKFLCGVSPPETADPDCTDFKVEYSYFEENIWPILAQRVPAFEALEVRSSWAGHYAVNTKDRNAILGSHPEISNFYFANGFSGHGLQHAPAVGRAISELITTGAYQTLDLSTLDFERFEKGELVLERNVV